MFSISFTFPSIMVDFVSLLYCHTEYFVLSCPSQQIRLVLSRRCIYPCSVSFSSCSHCNVVPSSTLYTGWSLQMALADAARKYVFWWYDVLPPRTSSWVSATVFRVLTFKSSFRWQRWCCCFCCARCRWHRYFLRSDERCWQYESKNLYVLLFASFTIASGCSTEVWVLVLLPPSSPPPHLDCLSP